MDDDDFYGGNKQIMQRIEKWKKQFETWFESNGIQIIRDANAEANDVLVSDASIAISVSGVEMRFTFVFDEEYEEDFDTEVLNCAVRSKYLEQNFVKFYPEYYDESEIINGIHEYANKAIESDWTLHISAALRSRRFIDRNIQLEQSKQILGSCFCPCVRC